MKPSPPNGYVMYLVVVILAILGISIGIASDALLRTHHFVLNQSFRQQAHLLAESGAQRAIYYLKGNDGRDISWETDSLREEMPKSGAIQLTCKSFGAYKRVISIGFFRDVSDTLIRIIGTTPFPELSRVITLSVKDANLRIDNQTTIIGKVGLFDGNIINKETEKIVKGSKPWTIIGDFEVLPFPVKDLQGILDKCADELASSISNPGALTGMMVFDKTKAENRSNSVIIVHGDCSISDMRFYNIALYVTGTVTIGANAVLKDCKVFSNKLRIDEGESSSSCFYTASTQNILGGIHQSQFIAGDSICIGNKPRFGNQTLFLSKRSVPNDSTIAGGIYISDNSAVTGCAICFIDTTQKNNPKLSGGTAIILGSKCFFAGYLISDEGIVVNELVLNGHIWVRQIYSKSEPGPNRLCGSTIHPYSKEMVMPLVRIENYELRISNEE